MSIVCFGEILWDELPTGRQPGGAPANVAVHARQLGLPARLLSAVGDDEPGRTLRAFLASRGLPTDLVATLPGRRTGVVEANVADAHEVRYTIAQPVAWDFIAFAEAQATAVAAADALVYGTLAARQNPSRATLHRLKPLARRRVFDVNLRPPHYEPAQVLNLLQGTDLLKLNHHELAQLLSWLGQPPAPPEAALPALAARFGLEAACVTLGAEGALLYTGGQLYHQPAQPVQVVDTIGAGDAFLAALLTGWLGGQPPADYLRLACAAGALVAAQAGATPVLARAQVESATP